MPESIEVFKNHKAIRTIEDDEIYDFGKEYDNSFKLMIDGLKMAVEQLVQ